MFNQSTEELPNAHDDHYAVDIHKSQRKTKENDEIAEGILEAKIVALEPQGEWH